MAKYLTKNVQENCYMVRIMRQGKKYQKNFSKKKYGGWRKAEAAAKEWRDEMLETLPPIAMNQEGRSANNLSGVVGVYLANANFTKRGKQYDYWRWVAKWPGCERRGGMTWSVNKYGEAEAFALAVLSRELRSVDREAILARFKKLKGTKKLEKIYEKRNLILEY
ncbi:MAG: hypothetical protein Q7Q71_11350 [Verrucomicrobiota bacterium JB023]|nr:hypothetical protein [Verrucomicrobiota bacterium JB023]